MVASIFAGLIVILVLPPELEPDGNALPLDFPRMNVLLNEFSGFILEFMGSMIVTWMYFSMMFDKRVNDPNVYGFAIGSSYYLSTLCFGNLTGACINPMRHFGPALLSGYTDNLWVYWLGPMFGTFISGFYYWYSIMPTSAIMDTSKTWESMTNVENINEAMNLTY